MDIKTWNVISTFTHTSPVPPWQWSLVFRQDNDFKLLRTGDPIFLSFDGETLRHKGRELYPFFVNECAYYEKKVAFILGEKVTVAFPSISVTKNWRRLRSSILNVKTLYDSLKYLKWLMTWNIKLWQCNGGAVMPNNTEKQFLFKSSSTDYCCGYFWWWELYYHFFYFAKINLNKKTHF